MYTAASPALFVAFTHSLTQPLIHSLPCSLISLVDKYNKFTNRFSFFSFLSPQTQKYTRHFILFFFQFTNDSFCYSFILICSASVVPFLSLLHLSCSALIIILLSPFLSINNDKCFHLFLFFFLVLLFIISRHKWRL